MIHEAFIVSLNFIAHYNGALSLRFRLDTKKPLLKNPIVGSRCRYLWHNGSINSDEVTASVIALQSIQLFTITSTVFPTEQCL